MIQYYPYRPWAKNQHPRCRGRVKETAVTDAEAEARRKAEAERLAAEKRAEQERLAEDLLGEKFNRA